MSLSRDPFLGFVKLRVLYHTGRRPVYEVWMIDKSGRHGYDLSPGTVYPTLHGLRKDGSLACDTPVVEGKRRKHCALTEAGAEALDRAREKAGELLNEVLDESEKQQVRPRCKFLIE